MRLSQIRYFQEVCRCNSFTKAANNLHISQPSVTLAIKELESELGINLFFRINRKISLTNEGKYFLEKTNEIIGQLDSLYEYMKDLGNKKNHVKIGIPPMMSSFLFPAIFTGFKKLYPEIELEILEHGVVELEKLLCYEVIDLAFLIDESEHNINLNFKRILQSEYKFYVNPKHRFSKLSKIEYEDIANEPLVMLNEDFYIYHLVMHEFKSRGLTPYKLLKTGQVNTLKRFLAENIATTFMTEDYVMKEDNLVEIALPNPLTITICLAWKKERYLYSDNIKFIDFINNLIRK